MFALRRLVLRHRHAAMLLLALALLAKMVVPVGYMPTVAGKTLTLAMCNGAEPVTISIPTDGGDNGKASHEAKDSPCAFSALGAQALAATDPVVLAAALIFAFVFALFALPLPPLRRISHLRPPLRGPPAAA